MTKYEAVIGLECHAQLRTQSKLFCSCSTRFGSPANINTCPVCLGLPGALPVLNRVAVQMAIRAAQGLNCTINPVSQWARKNYFYPDLSKGYQISQYDRPFAVSGFLEVGSSDSRKRIGVQRIHMEEDAAKSLHEGFSDSGRYTYLDFNRSGIPLVEIVSAPDIRSSEEAHEYLSKLKQILEYLDVCDGNMEEGSLRCDANVSVRPAGRAEFGTRTELKNLNSFRYLQKAIDFEVRRHVQVLDGGGAVAQETRLWNSAGQRTVSMRSKEEASDYRYFPEPDLPLLRVDQDTIRKARSNMAELPEPRRKRFVSQYGLSEHDAGILTFTRALADYFEVTAQLSGQPKAAANWITGDLRRLLNARGPDPGALKDSSRIPISPRMLADMLLLVKDGTISGKIAKTVFEEMFETAKHPRDIVEEKALQQISDSSKIERTVDQVLADYAGIVKQYRAGKSGVFGFFVGQVMKAMGGRANPQTVDELLRKKLAG